MSGFNWSSHFRGRGRSTAHRLSVVTTRNMVEIIRRARPMGLRPDEVRMLDEVCGLSRGTQLTRNASNLRSRAVIHRAVADVIQASWEGLNRPTALLLSFTADRWMTPTELPVIDLLQIKSDVRNWLKRLEVEAVAFIEIAHFRAQGSAPEPHFYPHVHAIVMDPAPGLLAAVREMQSRGAEKCAYGSLLHVQEIEGTAADIRRVASYCVKALISAKVATESRREAGRVHLRDNPAQPSMALRCVEVLSYLTFGELIFSRGDQGQQWRSGILAMLERTTTGSRDYSAPDLRPLWSNVRRLKGKPREPIVIRRRRGE